MTKKKASIITLLIALMLLSACSIGKKNQGDTENTNLTVEAEQNKVEKENNTEEALEDNSKDNVENKENRLVLPEVEVEGYGDGKNGD